MTSKIQKFIVTVSVCLLVIVLGCAAIQDVVIPCYIPPESLDYADTDGTSILPWTTLFDAKLVSNKMDFKHSWNQLTDKLKYDYLSESSQFYILAGEEAKAAIFSPTGPLGLLVTTALGGTVGSLLIPRPTDKKKIKELEAKNNSKNT